jgi:hypothetical protein
MGNISQLNMGAPGIELGVVDAFAVIIEPIQYDFLREVIVEPNAGGNGSVDGFKKLLIAMGLRAKFPKRHRRGQTEFVLAGPRRFFRPAARVTPPREHD